MCVTGGRGGGTGVANPLKYAQVPFSVGDPEFTTVMGGGF